MDSTKAALQIYDSLTQSTRPFAPLDASGAVKMYVCGITVYDFCHVGHGRTSVVFDTIARHLRYLGYQLNYVRNITDIDDKIIQRAEENATSIAQLTQTYTETMYSDERWLGNLAANQSPKASEYIAHMHSFISNLINTGYAYVAGAGDVYFRVRLAVSYGKLSKRKINELLDGDRIENKKEKEDPLDFALWKAMDANEIGWPSPWGHGRPGWHIECSTMVEQCLGRHIDIHGGGSDLIFPHHENEIAQSEARFGAPLANFWMHSGAVMVGEDKMSKSLDNFVFLNNLKEQYAGKALRFYFLQNHYRSPMEFSMKQLEARINSWERIHNCYQRYADGTASGSISVPMENDYLQAFDQALNNDFNTPEAIAVMFAVVREINTAGQPAASRELCRVLGHMLQRLGLDDAEDIGTPIIDESFVEEQLQVRRQAREEHDWESADHIREQLLRMGIVIQDHIDGSTSWRSETE